jgi:hypothetical protein
VLFEACLGLWWWGCFLFGFVVFGGLSFLCVIANYVFVLFYGVLYIDCFEE